MAYRYSSYLTAVLLIVTVPGVAEARHPPVKVPDATISGRVFLITEGGDLKPARFADVYLMSAKAVDGDSAATIFLGENDRELESYIESGGANSSSDDCRADLLMIKRSVAVAAKWAAERNLNFALLSTESDEEGQFHFKGIRLDPHTGKLLLGSDGKEILGYEWEYEVVAEGHAGANQAYWETHLMVVRQHGKTQWKVGAEDFIPGQDIRIKLPSPEKSCLIIS